MKEADELMEITRLLELATDEDVKLIMENTHLMDDDAWEQNLNILSLRDEAMRLIEERLTELLKTALSIQ
jgi:hypothetical protein